ncbi:MAG TPA: serine/threonine-protein kinase [Armatimonadetes bacterium]|nr:serine/threonine-protein kinase [Armatimonadota bacterium]
MAEEVLLNRYELHETLGEGPLFITWRAYDRKQQCKVVLKLLRPALAMNDAAARTCLATLETFRQQTLPGFVPWTVCAREGGYYFFVREYVSATPLAAWRRSRRTLSWQEAVNLILLLTDLLKPLHERGLVHGHLHPRNIFLLSNGRLCLTDASQALAQFRAFGPPGSRAGDPRYLAPEQRNGQAPTPQSDLFALGAILYELLTGQPLRTRSQQSSSGETDTVALPVKLRSGLPPALNEILFRMLQPNPSSRYPSVEALAEDLRGLKSRVTGRITARREVKSLAPPWPWRVLQGIARVLLVLFGILLLTGLLLAAAAAGAYYYWVSTIPEEVIVPDVRGKPVAEAREWLAELGLSLQVIAEQPSDHVPADCILRTRPPGGRHVRAGRNIQAIVSTGKELVTVPNLVDHSLPRARVLLRRVGLRVGTVQRVEDPFIPKDYIISQSPPPGVKMVKGNTVNLRVSKGPPEGEETAKPPPSLAEMPEKRRLGTVKIVVPPDPRLQRVKIIVRDEEGEHLVHDRLHYAGDIIEEPIEGRGESWVEVYLNDILVERRQF